ncbi:MAG: surface-adhesin E family protein [Betaproteobacteria bacterium]
MARSGAAYEHSLAHCGLLELKAPVMKKIITLVLLLTTLPAWSQAWIRYAQTESATLYFDSLRTRKMGDTAFVWDLHDLNTPAVDATGRTYRSIMHATEYQCRIRQRRVLSILLHNEPMAKGASVEIVSSADWTATPPDTLAGELFNHICE